MKAKIQKIFSLLVLIGLLFPFDLTKVALASNTLSSQAAQKPTVFTVIKVVNANTSAVVIPPQTNKFTPSLASCSILVPFNAAPAPAQVQNTVSGLLLSKSSDCFSLSVAAKTSAQVHLSVQPLLANARQIILPVSRPQAFAAKPSLETVPSAQTVPTLPVLFFASEIAFVFYVRKIFKDKFLSTNCASQVSLDLAQLQMLRC